MFLTCLNQDVDKQVNGYYLGMVSDFVYHVFAFKSCPNISKWYETFVCTFTLRFQMSESYVFSAGFADKKKRDGVGGNKGIGDVYSLLN